MKTHIPQDEIYRLVEIRLRENEDVQSYFFKVVELMDALMEANPNIWDTLSDETKLWYNTAIDAISEGKPIESFFYTLKEETEIDEDSPLKNVLKQNIIKVKKCKENENYLMSLDGETVILKCLKKDVVTGITEFEVSKDRTKIKLFDSDTLMKVPKSNQIALTKQEKNEYDVQKGYSINAEGVPFIQILIASVVANPEITLKEACDVLKLNGFTIVSNTDVRDAEGTLREYNPTDVKKSKIKNNFNFIKYNIRFLREMGVLNV